jgi:hypothetical protein
MKGHMSRTFEAIMAKLAPGKRAAASAHVKRLGANWQNGLESGGHVQRKLRLVFTNVSAHRPV